jgi:hypothetical protein
MGKFWKLNKNLNFTKKEEEKKLTNLEKNQQTF